MEVKIEGTIYTTEFFDIEIYLNEKEKEHIKKSHGKVFEFKKKKLK